MPLEPCPRLGKETLTARDKTIEQERFDESVPCRRPGAESVLVQHTPYRIESVAAAQLAAGGQRTCALDETGRLACWGGAPATFSAVVGALE